jgi:hypothetical protein
VFAEPCITESLIPPRTLAEWKATSTTLTNWVKAFCAVAILVDAEAPSAEVDCKETTFLDDAETFWTPFKKHNKCSNDSDKVRAGRGVVKVVKFVRHDRGLPPTSEVEELKSIVASGPFGKGGLTKIVADRSGIECGDTASVTPWTRSSLCRSSNLTRTKRKPRQ